MYYFSISTLPTLNQTCANLLVIWPSFCQWLPINKKANLKWWEIQLAVHCGVSSLITINSYRLIVNCKPAALSLLEIFSTLGIIELS